MQIRQRLWIYLGLSLAAAAAGTAVARIGETGWTLFGTLFLCVLVATLILEAVGFGSEVDRSPGPVERPVPDGIREKFARRILDRLPFALILIHADGRITYLNDSARIVAPWIERRSHYTNSFRAPMVLDAVKATFADGKSRSADFFVVSGTGERHLQAKVAILPKAFGRDQQRRVVMEIEDLTEKDASAKTRSRFVANASHELRTPLASILGYVETLLGPARDDPEIREEFLRIVHDQGLRMQRLIEDLMSLSDIEFDEHVPPESSCDVLSLAARAAEALRPLVEADGRSISVRLPEDGKKEMAGDPDQLTQVFVNLLDNAVRYGAGTITLELTGADPRFPGMFGIAVSDEGKGIAREHIPHLTERFYRVDASESRQKGGTGLGLAIVKHILNRHRGVLDIRSDPGAGSCFTIWLRDPETRS
ncbi:MAG: ATP-binding protein [Paracoccaceae bacterium]|nr:ATP-binding protein [Paracoccaceae bacterium]